MSVASFTLLRFQFASQSHLIKFWAIGLIFAVAATRVIFAAWPIIDSTSAFDPEYDEEETKDADILEELESASLATESVLSLILTALSIAQTAITFFACFVRPPNVWAQRIATAFTAQLVVRPR